MQLVNLGEVAREGSCLVNFEVQILRTDHWVLEIICGTEHQARDVARRLLTRHEGVRIVRDVRRPGSSRTSETIIFSEMRPAVPKPITIVPIDEAPICHTLAHYMGFGSRQTIARILRQYLEEKAVTASELLHVPAEMKRVMKVEALVSNAVSRIAVLQSKAAGGDAQARRDAIHIALNEIRARAEAALRRSDLPDPKKTGFPAALAQLERIAGESAEADYLARILLCRHTAGIQSLRGKIDWLIGLGHELDHKEESTQRYRAIVDGLVADIVGSATLIQDLLGRQPNLGTALIRLVDVLQGSYTPKPVERAPALTLELSRWIGAGLAPETHKALSEFLLRSIRGGQRLSNDDPEQQRQTFRTLLERLGTSAGLLGGAPMAEAVTFGYGRFVEQGGQGGRRLGIHGVLRLLPTALDRIHYLAALSRSELGRQETALLVDWLREEIDRSDGVAGLVPQELPLRSKLQSLASIYNALMASDLPGRDRFDLAGRIDDMTVDYIVKTRVIERLDDPMASLRIRATRLVEFAVTEAIFSPKVRQIVREQIIGYLRQPNFDAKFVEGIDSADEREQALRHFYDLLRQAQFT